MTTKCIAMLATLLSAATLCSASLHAQVAVNSADESIAAGSDDAWWKHAVVYQVYPRSFGDSDGDGTGHLNEITEHLDYLQPLGLDAIWLAPVYPSSQVDFGYDISSYEMVDPQCCTLANFDRLLTVEKKPGMLIVLDMVLNQTSDKST